MGFSFVSKALLGLITLNEMWLAVQHLSLGAGSGGHGSEMSRGG